LHTLKKAGLASEAKKRPNTEVENTVKTTFKA